MTELERVLKEIEECTNELENLIIQKSELDIEYTAKRKALKIVDEHLASIQSMLIKKNQKMSELDSIYGWLKQQGG